ncbi:hypothetical protein JAAARDRAFT_39848, partial [Jaapia argillacea MUCL 33604]
MQKSFQSTTSIHTPSELQSYQTLIRHLPLNRTFHPLTTCMFSPSWNYQYQSTAASHRSHPLDGCPESLPVLRNYSLRMNAFGFWSVERSCISFSCASLHYLSADNLGNCQRAPAFLEISPPVGTWSTNLPCFHSEFLSVCMSIPQYSRFDLL